MFHYSEALIHHLSIHHIGRKSESEGTKLSDSPADISDVALQEILMHYFFSSFKDPEYYGFTFPGNDISINPMYQFVDGIFNKPENLHDQSIQIAKYLYAQSDHPNIKHGDLFVTYIENILIGDELLNAVGIFKSESKSTFLKLHRISGTYAIEQDEGMPVEKLDKGCLIFNTEKEDGYKICIVDRVNTSSEAQFWKSNFLNVQSKSDAYHNTTKHIQLTKAFIDERLKPLYELDKTDEAGILHASSTYFRNENLFDDNAYADRLFPDVDMKKNYREYKMDYASERGVRLNDSFDISDLAVKKQSKIFKSVLKLDKNFHVYIHGDRTMIERGVDPDGRKFYKLYYDQERD